MIVNDYSGYTSVGLNKVMDNQWTKQGEGAG